MSASSPDEAERNRGYHAAWSSIAASVYRVATYFFTVTLRDRRKDWLTAHVDLLRSVVGYVRRERPFAIDAAVVLPDHLHAIFTLPAGDSDYSGRWRAIKAGFSRALAAAGLPARSRGPRPPQSAKPSLKSRIQGAAWGRQRRG